jgi:hypothetical protein
MSTMFVHFSDRFWLQVAEAASKSKELSVSTVLTPLADGFETSAVFEKAEVLRSSDFGSLSKVIFLNRDNPYALSKDDVRELSWAEVVFLTITDRNMAVPMSVQFRIQYYYELMRYWLHYLESREISHIFFQATPHLGYDYALYSAAKKRGIRTTIFQRTDIDNILFYADDYEGLTKVDRDYLEGISAERLRAMIEPEILNLLESPSFWLGKSRSINEAVLTDRGRKPIGLALHRSYRKLRKTLRALTTGATGRPLRSVLAERRLMRGTNRKIAGLYSLYRALAEKPNDSDEYVLFAMHFQPERTTLPEGGVFENQLLAIDILARALPEGWWLYVREHPRQFQKDDLRKTHFRDFWYYERIKANKNVKLISVHENQRTLIENARIVASVKGSAGWEAMTSGKPCIAFARAWYSASSACFVVDSVERCMEAVRKALEMDKETVLSHLYRFILFSRPRMILSAVCLEAAQKSVLGYEESVNNLADGIVRMVRGAEYEL